MMIEQKYIEKKKEKDEQQFEYEYIYENNDD